MLSCLRVNITTILILLGMISPMCLRADFSLYNCEIGLQAGASCYTGDAAKVFSKQSGYLHLCEAYGAQARYKFDSRWSLQVKGQRQRIAYTYSDTVWRNPMWNVDLTAEFNFFRFGVHPYDLRLKPVTPYIFIGVGVNMCNSRATVKDSMYPLVKMTDKPNVYIPVGIGVKWMFAERWQLHAAWQHQVYVTSQGDGIEGLPALNNTHNLNGTNFMNFDMTSTLTVAIVFEFWKKGDVCMHCDD